MLLLGSEYAKWFGACRRSPMIANVGPRAPTPSLTHSVALRRFSKLVSGGRVDGNRLERLTRPTGIVLWLVVAATVVVGRSGSPRFPYWAAYWSIGFVACLATSLTRVGRAWALPAIGVQGAMVGAMTALLGNGFEGLLLVPIALELRFRLRPFSAALGALAITVLFAAGVGFHMNAWSAWMLELPCSASQVLGLAARTAFPPEKALRTELASAHQELQALGPVLEEGSRNAELVRLSRE